MDVIHIYMCVYMREGGWNGGIDRQTEREGERERVKFTHMKKIVLTFLPH
jgi:hypothetical protein